jgi:hypothetical protein
VGIFDRARDADSRPGAGAGHGRHLPGRQEDTDIVAEGPGVESAGSPGTGGEDDGAPADTSEHG